MDNERDMEVVISEEAVDHGVRSIESHTVGKVNVHARFIACFIFSYSILLIYVRKCPSYHFTMFNHLQIKKV